MPIERTQQLADEREKIEEYIANDWKSMKLNTASENNKRKQRKTEEGSEGKHHSNLGFSVNICSDC